MVININSSDSNNSSSLGTITFSNTKENYKIDSIFNNLITATSTNSPMKIIFIKFNILKDDDINIINDTLKFNIFSSNSNFSCVVSIFNGNNLHTKYISFKLYEIEDTYKVDSDVYRVIKSNDIYINRPPANYDYDTYFHIINSYKFSSDSDYITLSLRPVLTVDDQKIYDLISTYYDKKLTFSIQREFIGPTGNTIVTKESQTYIINAISKNSGTKKIPDKMRVPIFNFIMSKCNIKALSLEDDLNLPYHIPMPRLEPPKEDK
jgi:hypothetical protein